MCEQRHRCGLAGLTKMVTDPRHSSPSPKRPVSPAGRFFLRICSLARAWRAVTSRQTSRHRNWLGAARPLLGAVD